MTVRTLLGVDGSTRDQNAGTIGDDDLNDEREPKLS